MPSPLDARYVLVVERKLGARLPENYRLSMMRANGGAVRIRGDTWWLYPLADDSDSHRFARTWADIAVETESCREMPGFPQGAVVIGHNGFGDYLLFLRDGDRFGPAVYQWVLESQQTREIEADFGMLERR